MVDYNQLYNNTLGTCVIKMSEVRRFEISSGVVLYFVELPDYFTGILIVKN